MLKKVPVVRFDKQSMCDRLTLRVSVTSFHRHHYHQHNHHLIQLPPTLPPIHPYLSVFGTVFGEPKVVCVRTAETAEDVEAVILALRNTTGRKVKP